MGEKRFEYGDKVMLMSGGPVMTVQALVPSTLPAGGTHVTCQWFPVVGGMHGKAIYGGLNRGTFRAETLIEVTV